MRCEADAMIARIRSGEGKGARAGSASVHDTMVIIESLVDSDCDAEIWIGFVYVGLGRMMECSVVACFWFIVAQSVNVLGGGQILGVTISERLENVVQ